MERRQETRGAGRAAGGLMDLHTHSACSDGDRAPAALVESAAQSGVGLLALTDHDSVRGVPEAVAAGRRLGLPVVPGVEMSNEFPQELHILGLGVDVENPALLAELAAAQERRRARGRLILERLCALGADARPYLAAPEAAATRVHIALALVSGGFAADVKDAFARYIGRGAPAYVALPRPAPARVIALISGAGGSAAR